MLTFDQAYSIPGQTAEYMNAEEQVWYGREEQQLRIQVFMDGNAVDSGNTGATTILRPGLLLGWNPTTKKFKQWNPAAVDGTQYIVGPMLYDQQMAFQGVGADRWFGYTIAKGNLKAAKLIIPGNTSAGISGDNYEWLARAQLTGQGRFILDDYSKGNIFGGYQAVQTMGTLNTAGTYTLVSTDNDVLFTNSGYAGPSVFTLPTPKVGLRFSFASVTTQNLTITSASAGQLVAFNNAAATTLAFATSNQQIGAGFDVVGIVSGTSGKWLVIPRGWGGNATNQVQTVTIS